jgi:hypothetical protein
MMESGTRVTMRAWADGTHPPTEAVPQKFGTVVDDGRAIGTPVLWDGHEVPISYAPGDLIEVNP